MELAFDSQSLRSICEKSNIATRKLGPIVAELLKHRLADLRAARYISDLLAGAPHVLERGNHQVATVSLGDRYRLIFSANHPKNPVTEQGLVDWSRVSRIKILKIESENGTS